MTFEEFARAHGLVIDHAIHNRWIATPTTDHPHKRNGRYKFLGDVGWVQNWATMEGPAMWKSDKPVAMRPVTIKDDRAELAEKAAKKAAWILNQCELKTHPYLEKKGFPEDRGNVWETDGKSLLVIPMRRSGRLVGCQMISAEGEKKFLYGQATKGAALTIDAKGIPIFCEGYATALSIRAIMQAVKMRYTIYCCFSAGNMKEVARNIVGGLVVADNDASGTGQKAALDIGKPYWIAPTVGHDFNDAHNSMGVFHLSQSLKKVLISAARAAVENAPQSA